MTNSKRYFLLFFIVLLILQYRLWFGKTGIIASRLLENETVQTIQTIKKLQQENKHLKEKALFYEKNPEVLEGIARKVFNLTRENETLIKIQSSDSANP